MNILNKIMTAIKGGSRELGEAIIDAQGTRIFEQEIEDAKQSLKKAKQELTQVMAKHIKASRVFEATNKDIEKNEAYVTQALTTNKEPLALEMAAKVAELEHDRQHQQETLQTYNAHIEKLKAMIEGAERQLKDYERQLSMVKTTENVQKATATITEKFATADSSLLSAKASLQRIKKKQQDFEDHHFAIERLEQEITSENLIGKIKLQGDDEQKNGAQAVLSRIKADKSL